MVQEVVRNLVKPQLVTISDKDRYQPKPSGAKPTSTKPVDEKQRSQVVRDRKSVLMLGSDKKEKPMKTSFMVVNILIIYTLS